MTENDPLVNRLQHADKSITILGTAHVSKESAQLVSSVIRAAKPDTVCVELCLSRYQSLRHRDRWQETDIVQVIKEKKAFLLLSNLLLASFQKRIAEKLDIQPGAEMMAAVESAEAVGATVHLVDRDIRTTLSRTWRALGLRQKLKLFFQLLLSFGDVDEIEAADVERLKQEDVLQAVLSDVGQSMPELKKILIDERDQYLAEKIRSAPGRSIVAVVGAGHVPGIKRYWEKPVDTRALDQMPPKGRLGPVLKWLLPLLILLMLAWGFYQGGSRAGVEMVGLWVLANGLLAGAGAVAALAHPLTVAASLLAAPLTSLNPMIAAGWVAGLLEALLRKPKVRDFQNLQDDLRSFRGFWRNKLTRILLVVVFTNLGSAAGTFVAIPLMVRLI